MKVKSIHLVCPACRHHSLPEDLHCSRCGSRLIRDSLLECPSCNHPLGTQPEPHCAHCGAYILRSHRTAGVRNDRTFWPWFAATVVAASLVWFAQTTRWNRDHETLGGVRLGQVQEQVKKRLGMPERRQGARTVVGSDGSPHRIETWQYRLSGNPVPGLLVVFLDDRVAQVGSSSPDYTTRKGLGIGDDLPRAEALYGKGIETLGGSGIRIWRVRHGDGILSAYVVGEGGAILFLTLERATPMPFETGNLEPSAPDEPATAL